MKLEDMIAEKRSELSRICERRSVKSLELFGSAARDEAGGESDLDFLVEFEALDRGEHAEAYFGLREDLEELFGRPVDLVMITAVHNPYFLKNIESSRRVLYAA